MSGFPLFGFATSLVLNALLLLALRALRRRATRPKAMRWRIPWKREHPPERLRPGDVVRLLNGELSIVVRLEYHVRVLTPVLEPIDEVLTSSFTVFDGSTMPPKQLAMREVLLAAGWKPPAPGRRIGR